MDAYHSGDTMIDAIALSSPSGRMSNRARKAAQQRLSQKLFPNGVLGIDFKVTHEPTAFEKAKSMRQRAQLLRELAERGMKPRAYKKEAERLEAEASRLEVILTHVEPHENWDI